MGRRSDPLSLNLYTYCHNNPIRYIDPSGHYAKKKDGSLMAINSEWDYICAVTDGDIECSQETYDKAYKRRYDDEPLVNANNKTLISKKQLESVSYEMDGLTVSWAGMSWDDWSGISDESVEDLNRVLNKYNINTTERIAHFIGQCSIEARCGSWLTEYGGEEYLSQKDYYPYYGAGYIQLTWEENYSKFADAMGDKNIMDGPQYVADNYAWEAAGWFWSNNNLNNMVDSGATVYDITQVVRGYDNNTWQMREQAYNATKKALRN